MNAKIRFFLAENYDHNRLIVQQLRTTVLKLSKWLEKSQQHSFGSSVLAYHHYALTERPIERKKHPSCVAPARAVSACLVPVSKDYVLRCMMSW